MLDCFICTADFGSGSGGREKNINVFFTFFYFFLNISFYLRIFYLFFVRFPLQNANGEEMSDVLFRFILLYYFA